MKEINPISPEELKHNTGGRANGVAVLSQPGEAGWEIVGLRSSEVNEVLSQPPSWLVRWGITVFFFVLLILLGVGWFVEYPDLVKANLRVVAVNFPKAVNAKSEGVVMKLFVKDGMNVTQGQRLAYLESTANPGEVLRLDTVVTALVTLGLRGDLEDIHKVTIPLYFQLGELQKSYQTFQDAYVRSKALLRGGAFEQKRLALQNDLTQLGLLRENLQTQLDNYRKDLELTEDDLRMNRKLHEEKVIADVEMRQTRSRYLSKKQVVDQAQTAFNNNGMLQNQKQQELLELEKTRIEQLNSLFQSINTLKSDTEAWKQRFVSAAPTNGKVAFLTPLQEGQTVKAGQELFYVLPEGAGFEGEMYVGQYNFGKVRHGQEVIVKFAGYPYQEFGTVSGRIASISDMPKDTAYLVKVQFPKGLVTSSQKKIPFRNGMTATGEIVTEDLKLIERLFYDFRKVLRR
ncbi:HlyD family efflux transporter periplasmic adaptor subunit [Runella aurantiaca]|uniref:HlyD family efflux transporter periplasmic adaptor subunit n=1 Tax=Runella aurantiaca TaxID=2282308 RepID=A0A369I662_9BACT|nr:HlyD family efflux transporter periplasmic adaptor subunit [Runella aurantiaca]RDB05078.1 HlyD family efflux transporter periplasmic adaptor subunit [Runella aurantiaca]